MATSPYTGRLLPGNSRLAASAAGDGRASDPRPVWSIINPSARDRWLSTSLASYTPQYIENIIRGAMAGNLVSQWQMFDLMEATWPRLLKNLNELKDAALAFNWTLQPWAVKGGKPTPEAQRRADFIEELLWNMEPESARDENDFEDTVWNLCDARGKGVAVLEVDWTVKPTRFGQAVAPRATRWVHPRYYGWPVQDDQPDRLMLNRAEVEASGGDLAAAVNPGQPGEWVEFPPDKFLLGICKTKSGHPISGPLLRTLGFWWAAANFTGEWFLNYAQMFGQPIRWATFDPNLSLADQNKLATMLERMGSQAFAMFPTGTQLELKEAAKGAGDNPQLALLNFADKVCDILVLRQTLTTDVGGSGSRALGEVHQDVLSGVKYGVANWAARVLNRQLIQPICRQNFRDLRECPFLQVTLDEKQDPKAVAEFLEIAGKIVDLPKADTYERLGIPMPGENDDVIPAQRGSTPPPGPGVDGGEPVAARAKASDATGKLVDNVLEQLTGVEAKWLAGVKPFFLDLVNKAQNEEVTDEQFIHALARAQRELPELFNRLDHDAVADALEAAMGAAAVNGATQAAMRRRRKGAS